MARTFASFASVTDQQLVAEVKTLVAREREATASLIASLAEFDARRLYLGEGFPSLFTYCTQALHLSEHAAYNRIETARAARKWPLIVQLIADGSVTPTAVRLLAGLLTDANHRDLLDAATHKTKREVEQLVAALHPQDPVPSIVRKLPAPKPGTVRSSTFDGRDLASSHPTVSLALETESHHVPGLPPPSPAVIAPLASDRFKVQITITRETHDKLRRVQDLLRHQLPTGDPAAVFDRALTLLGSRAEGARARDSSEARSPGNARIAACACGGAARGMEKRRWPVRIHWERRKVHGARLHRVPPRRSVRGWRSGHAGESATAVQGAQHVRS